MLVMLLSSMSPHNVSHNPQLMMLLHACSP